MSSPQGAHKAASWVIHRDAWHLLVVVGRLVRRLSEASPSGLWPAISPTHCIGCIKFFET
jgi:hypothetical protein